MNEAVTNVSTPAPVRDFLVKRPKTLAVPTTVGEIRRTFASAHVHMVLLVEHGKLIATVERGDIPEDMPDHGPADGVGRLSGRAIGPEFPAEVALRYLNRTGRRRLAVVDGEGMLLGLLCRKRSGTGFCSDRDVMARAAESRLSAMGRPAGQPQRAGRGG